MFVSQCQHLVAYLPDVSNFVAGDSDLDRRRRAGHVQLLNPDERRWKAIAVFTGVFSYNFFSCLIGCCIDKDLCIILGIQVWCVHGMKAWRTGPDKTGIVYDPFIFTQDALHSFDNCIRLCEVIAVRKVYLYGKLVSFNCGEKLLMQLRHKEYPNEDRQNTKQYSKPVVL